MPSRKLQQTVAAALRAASVAKQAPKVQLPVVGALTGKTSGRADQRPVSVADGSHVIPADVVSALGDGNSQNGHKVLFGMFPGSKKLKPPRPGALTRLMGGTKTAKPNMMATGGAVEIMASDGEFVVSPDDVRDLAGKGDHKRGHAVLNALIKKVRSQNIDRLKSLPGPVE